MRTFVKGLAVALGVVVLFLVFLAVTLRSPAERTPSSAGRPPAFSHVFVIVMENESAKSLLQNPYAGYIRELASRYAYDGDYFGVTHPSLPNYVALISGRTFGTHSDNPAQRFAAPTLAGQLDQAHVSWQGVMQSLPRAGFLGSWSPGTSEAPPTLYAAKHDPFMLFDPLRRRDANHVVPLSTLVKELQTRHVPRFVFVVPNLCNDMHGQAPGPHALCPEGNRSRRVADGNQFLASLVPRILHSPAWRGNAVIFILWDEGGGTPTINPGPLRRYMAAGPGSPPLVPAAPILGRFGGGQVALIVIARNGPRHLALNLWADHYSVLKTIEASWHLPFLGHAKDAKVPLLTPLVTPRP